MAEMVATSHHRVDNCCSSSTTAEPNANGQRKKGTLNQYRNKDAKRLPLTQQRMKDGGEEEGDHDDNNLL